MTDLDLSLVMIDEIGNIKDAVFYNQLESKCGAVVHTGDQSGKTQKTEET
jgi:stress response protein SCP2